jgi:uncharacterized glyoxalase superfamily protein PhnB
MTLEPYLFFNGRCEEAMAFYKEAIGAEVSFQMRMSEAPDQPPPGAIPAGFENKIMHAHLRIGAMSLMVSDGNSDMQPSFKGFCLSLNVADAAEPSASSTRWPKAARSPCRWAKHSGHPALARWKTALAWAGWWACFLRRCLRYEARPPSCFLKRSINSKFASS